MDVSIIIINHNTLQLTQNCIDSISGFKVLTGDGSGLARILTKLLELPISHLSEFRRTTRIVACAKHSYKAFSDRVTALIKSGSFNIKVSEE